MPKRLGAARAGITDDLIWPPADCEGCEDLEDDLMQALAQTD